MNDSNFGLQALAPGGEEPPHRIWVRSRYAVDNHCFTRIGLEALLPVLRAGMTDSTTDESVPLSSARRPF